MYKYKMIIAYDGTVYCGWQVQPQGISIQSTLQNALQTVLQQKIGVTASGRTDAGVHAKGQVVHFFCSCLFDPSRYIYRINSILPHDIRVKEIEMVDSDFHARYSAKYKTYHYYLISGSVADPFQRLYSYHYPFPLNLEGMKEAAKFFVGTHDFKSFAHCANKGVAAYDSVRTIIKADVAQTAERIQIEFVGNGFLHKMVRNMVGTLLDVGAGRKAPDCIVHLLQNPNRSLAGATAPSHGLFLMHVCYD